MSHDKDRVAAAFAAAATTYESAAEVQALAAEALAARVLGLWLPPAPRVLEVGCGTGLLTRRLLPVLAGRWMVTDVAPAMVAAAEKAVGEFGALFRVMDGEHPDVAEGCVDLLVSNLAAQWFTDLPAALAGLARLLAPGGRLLLTTLGRDTFSEWRAVHQRLGLTVGAPDYPSAALLSRQLPPGRGPAWLPKPCRCAMPTDGPSSRR